MTGLYAFGFLGLCGLAVLLHVLGFGHRAPMTDAKVRQQWARHFPQDKIETVLLAQSGRSALVSTQTGLGLLWQFGSDTLARRLPPRSVRDHPKGLRLRFQDLTAPVVLVPLANEERETWKTAIEKA